MILFFTAECDIAETNGNTMAVKGRASRVWRSLAKLFRHATLRFVTGRGPRRAGCETRAPQSMALPPPQTRASCTICRPRGELARTRQTPHRQCSRAMRPIRHTIPPVPCPPCMHTWGERGFPIFGDTETEAAGSTRAVFGNRAFLSLGVASPRGFRVSWDPEDFGLTRSPAVARRRQTDRRRTDSQA
jgi:hypothetical protein